MEGLDQVSDDAGCWDGPVLQFPRNAGVNVRHGGLGSARLDRQIRIARTIEGEVIPRLLLAHRVDRTGPDDAVAVAFDADTPERFADLVLMEDADTALQRIRGLLAGGLPLESIYLDVLAPAARRLGQRWTDDEISFADVTIGLARLQRIMRTLSASLANQAARHGSVGPVLLAAMPGEQHVFGVLMLEEFCRRDGIEVECLPACSQPDLMCAVERRAPAIVGLSASVDDCLDAMRDLVRDLRRVAPRPDMLVMVGGRCFLGHPELVDVVGADFTAVDGSDAIRQIHSYLSTGLNSPTKP